MKKIHIKRGVKLLHSLGAVGMMGSMAAHLILLATAPDDLAAYASLRASIAMVTKYLFFPSLAVVLISGLLSMMVHQPFQEQRWVWAKALLGISVFEGSLGAIASTSQQAVELSQKIAAGEGNQEAMAELMRHEWGGLWVLIVLALVNIVLAIWRPRLKRRRSASESYS